MLGVALCVLLQAHEIGASRVSAEFRADRSYAIEIVTDAISLAEKLEAASGRPPTAPNDPGRLQAMLQASDERFRKKIELSFDKIATLPAAEYSVLPPANAAYGPSAVIRLTGQIPSGARQFTWSYGWTYTTYALAVQKTGVIWLEGDQRSKSIELAAVTIAPSRLATIGRYLALGFTHIVPLGLDHMLFVLGIYLLNTRAQTLLWQVSAFTIAHSITLGLSMLGLLRLPPRIVEPAIAISIAYVAIENLFVKDLKPWRIALIFAFGLLHGLGFAGALQESGMPSTDFLTALLSFNVGVEAGQLAVIGTAFLLFGWRFSGRIWYRQWIVAPASVMIAIAAVYWTFERISA